MSSTNQSHASGDSIVPPKAQEKLPKGVEESVPNSIHDTGSQGRQSHATGESIVPEKLQEILPESVERAVPDSLHDTSGLAPKKGNGQFTSNFLSLQALSAFPQDHTLTSALVGYQSVAGDGRFNTSASHPWKTDPRHDCQPRHLKEAPRPTIYHRLLDMDAHKSYPIPDVTALYEEAQTMTFAGGVTVGDMLMTGLSHILDHPSRYEKLRAETLTAWPRIASLPMLEVLEGLPLLTATVKKSPRMAPGACSPLLRVIPTTGATISGKYIPSWTIVGMSSVLFHKSSAVFKDPEVFKPKQWLGKNAKNLDQWLMSLANVAIRRRSDAWYSRLEA